MKYLRAYIDADPELTSFMQWVGTCNPFLCVLTVVAVFGVITFIYKVIEEYNQ